jgi:hypothetical protein
MKSAKLSFLFTILLSLNFNAQAMEFNAGEHLAKLMERQYEIYKEDRLQNETSKFSQLLSWCHKRKLELNEFVDPSEPKKESFWKKLIKAPLRIGRAILNPMSWFKTNVVSPAMTRAIYYPTKLAVGKVEQKLIGLTEEDYEEMGPRFRGAVEMVKNQLSYSIAQGASGIAAATVTNRVIDKLSYKMLKKISPDMPIPDPKNYPLKIGGQEITYQQAMSMYKDDIAKHIIEKFENKLPEKFQNGKGFEYYKKGKKVYGNAKFVFDLVDNTLSTLSLSYQLTNHAELTGQAPNTFFSKMGKLKKFIIVLDIIRRCSDSYLKITNKFNLGKSSSAMKSFNRCLRWFMKGANAICPHRESICALWDSAQDIYNTKKMFNEMEKAATKTKNELYQNDPNIKNLKHILKTKFNFEENDIEKFVIAMFERDEKTCEQILEEYEVSDADLEMALSPIKK